MLLTFSLKYDLHLPQSLSDLIVRGLYCHRIWKLSQRNLWMTVAVASISLLSFASGFGMYYLGCSWHQCLFLCSILDMGLPASQLLPCRRRTTLSLLVSQLRIRCRRGLTDRCTTLCTSVAPAHGILENKYTSLHFVDLHRQHWRAFKLLCTVVLAVVCISSWI